MERDDRFVYLSNKTIPIERITELFSIMSGLDILELLPGLKLATLWDIWLDFKGYKNKAEIKLPVENLAAEITQVC